MFHGLPALALLGLSAAGAAEPGAIGRDTLRGVADTLSFSLRPVAVAAASPAPDRGFEPAGVAADAFGRVYVTDSALHRLLRYEPDGTWLGEAGTLGSGEGEMRRPGAVAILGTLSVAVLDEENRRVVLYDLFGRLHGTLIDLKEPALLDELGRVDPVDLAADRGGAVYVADSERDRVLAFDSSGRYVRTLGGLGARPGSFRGLRGLTVHRNGDLVTAERVNARVQRLDSSGRVASTWPLPVRPTPGALPVAVDDSARVAVADAPTGRLWVFDPTGRPLAGLSGLGEPRALAFARDGTLLVAESGAGLVRRYRLAPRPATPGARER